MNNKEIATEIYHRHIGLASTDGRAFRRTVLTEIEKTTGCSWAAACTYYNNCKKAGPVIEGLGRPTVAKTARKAPGKGKVQEDLVEDDDCFAVIELVEHENNITVGRCQTFLQQGDASETFDGKISTWPGTSWVMIQGLGPMHGETYKLSSKEKEIKRHPMPA